MKIDVSYRLKSHPKPIKRTGRVLSLIGFMLLIFGAIQSLSPEIRAFFGLDTWLTISFTALGLVLTYFGFFLSNLDWRKGSFSLDHEQNEIRIEGEVPFTMRLEYVNEITVLNTKHGLKKSIQIKSPRDMVLIRFNNEDTLLNVSETLIKKTETYSSIVINNYTD